MKPHLKILAVRLSEARSGLDLILLLEGGGIRAEEVRLGRYFTMVDQV